MKYVIIMIATLCTAITSPVLAQDTTKIRISLICPEVKIVDTLKQKNYSSVDKEALKKKKKPVPLISGTTTINRNGEWVEIPVETMITLTRGFRVMVREKIFGGLGDTRREIVYLPSQFKLVDGYASVYRVAYPGGVVYIATPVNYFK